MTKIKIRAIEKYLPGQLVLSTQLEQQLGLSTGWVEKNTGVQSRYFSYADQTIASIGAHVLSLALTKAGLSMHDLDWLIYAGGSYDHPIPYNACRIKQAYGQHDAQAACFDVDATCLSFLHALDLAHLYLQAGRSKRIAIVSAEIASRSLNPNDPKTYTLFGDAAIATILEISEDGQGYTVDATSFANHPEGASYANIPTGGLVHSGQSADTSSESYYFQMEGKKLIRLTQQTVFSFVEKHRQKNGLPIAEYDFIIPHQPSRFGNEFFIKAFSLEEQRVCQNLRQYGNCISASIPLALEELINNHDVQNKNILLIGTAAGLSYGAISLQF
jgi:3-oxoacyl-[acyl-carrier-protein] synthase-3